MHIYTYILYIGIHLIEKKEEMGQGDDIWGDLGYRFTPQSLFRKCYFFLNLLIANDMPMINIANKSIISNLKSSIVSTNKGIINSSIRK